MRGMVRCQQKTSDGVASDKEESVILTAGGYQIREEERISDDLVRGQRVQKLVDEETVQGTRERKHTKKQNQ